MAAAYRSIATNSSTTASVAVSAPSGLTDGDILVASVHAYSGMGNISDITAPAGWTQVVEEAFSTSHHHALFWKRALSESGTYTFSESNASGMEASVTAFSGCIASGSPVDVYSDTQYTTSNTSIKAATMTTTADGDAILWFGWSYSGMTNITVTAPSGFTERADFANADTNAHYICTMVQASAGATGSMDGTLSDSVTDKHAMAVALKAAITTITGTGAAAAGAVSASGSGTVTISGTGALQVGAASISGAGSVVASPGVGAVTIGVRVAGEGTVIVVPVTGTGALQVGTVALAAVGSITSRSYGSLAGKAFILGMIGSARVLGLGGSAELFGIKGKAEM